MAKSKYGKKRSHSRKKRYGKKKSFKRRSTRSIPNGYPVRGSGLVRVQFADNFTISPVGTGIATKQYRINSIWDPSFAGGGQPMYHDQLQVLYDHYKVVGARITMRIVGIGDNGSQEYPIIVGFCMRDDSTLPTDVKQEIENGRCRTVMLTSHHQEHYLSMNFSSKKFFGKDRDDDEATGAQFGANPADIAWGHVFVKSQSSTAITPKVYADFKINFIVKVGEPKKLARS